MTKLFELLKFFKDPHTGKIQKFKDQYQELDELSNVSVQIGDVVAYKSLQAEMKEVFFDYLTAVAVDSIYKLVPHVLIIWVISLKWPNITIPFLNWQVSILGAYLVAYFVLNVGKWIVKPIKNRLSKSGLFSFIKVSTVTKI